LNQKEQSMLEGCGADEVLLPHQMAATNFYYSVLENLVTEKGIT
jgi:hypothetical protein